MKKKYLSVVFTISVLTILCASFYGCTIVDSAKQIKSVASALTGNCKEVKMQEQFSATLEITKNGNTVTQKFKVKGNEILVECGDKKTYYHEYKDHIQKYVFENGNWASPIIVKDTVEENKDEVLEDFYFGNYFIHKGKGKSCSEKISNVDCDKFIYDELGIEVWIDPITTFTMKMDMNPTKRFEKIFDLVDLDDLPAIEAKSTVSDYSPITVFLPSEKPNFVDCKIPD